jgi:hypothetical protein
VLVSTNSPQTMVVLPLGCTTQAIKPVPSDCANSRGGLFTSNQSSTWMDQGLYGINQDGVGFEANLGYSVDANYGLETVGLGFSGGPSEPTLENQTVAAIAAKSPFYTYVTPSASDLAGMLTFAVGYSGWVHSLSTTVLLAISQPLRSSLR